MTYCVAIKLDSGMLFAADSRTNAGVDHIATFSKMRIFEQKDDRMFVILSSGNLAVTQGVMNILDRHKHFEAYTESIWNVNSLFDVATLVGDALRDLQRLDGPSPPHNNLAYIPTPLLAGPARQQMPR